MRSRWPSRRSRRRPRTQSSSPTFRAWGGPPPPAQGLYGGLAGPMQYGGGYQYPTVVLPRGMVGPGRRGQASPQPSAGGMKSFGSGSPSRKRGGGGYGGGHD